jgi:hypothetical protein
MGLETFDRRRPFETAPARPVRRRFETPAPPYEMRRTPSSLGLRPHSVAPLCSLSSVVGARGNAPQSDDDFTVRPPLMSATLVRRRRRPRNASWQRSCRSAFRSFAGPLGSFSRQAIRDYPATNNPSTLARVSPPQPTRTFRHPLPLIDPIHAAPRLVLGASAELRPWRASPSISPPIRAREHAGLCRSTSSASSHSVILHCA